MPVESLYQIPRVESERETTLHPNELVTHVVFPSPNGRLSAAYEVRHGEGPDMPLAAAAASLEIDGGRSSNVRIVLGQVAPIPWIAGEAERALEGNVLDERTIERACAAATAGAMPLSHNNYKIQLAQVAAKRAILRAIGSDTGGF